MHSNRLIQVAFAILQYFARFVSANCGPHINTSNGTIEGAYLPAFNEDIFFGIPFAAPPIGPLRLRRPVPYQKSWRGIRNATVRPPSCPGYGQLEKSANLTVAEDCLTLDVVRPSGTTQQDKLPVFVWIYGGNFVAGASGDSRYNTSYIVNASISIQQPIIAVSINYRLGGWGFLASKEVAAAGELNIGLFDQRLALKWIQENIQAFGGDPTKVTIGGESAGGFSVGYHLTAFDGVNDGLFRGAILQSGNGLGPAVYSAKEFNSTYQPIYDNVTESVGCSNTTDSLDCLRTIPYEALFSALAPFSIYPVIDGEFFLRLPSESFKEDRVANVAILAGTNTDEGTAFAPRDTLDTDADIHAFVSNINFGLSDSAVGKIMELYPDDPGQGCPFGTGLERFASQGYMFKRGAAIIADEIFHAGRRFLTDYYSSRPQPQRLPVYSYRFDQPPWNGVLIDIVTVVPVYSTHFSEICHVFNIEPSASINNTNWIGPRQEFYALSTLMSRSWISFIHGLDPNNHGIDYAPYWPDYSNRRENFVFRVNASYVETDNWRAAQLQYWGQNWKQLYT